MYARCLVEELLNLGCRILRCTQFVTICIVFTNFGLFSGSASAQSASFRSVDSNSDGVLTFDELLAEFGRAGANRLLQSADHNGDGRITISELRRGPDDEDRQSDQRPGSSSDPDDDRDDGDDGGGDDGGDDAGDDD